MDKLRIIHRPTLLLLLLPLLFLPPRRPRTMTLSILPSRPLPPTGRHAPAPAPAPTPAPSPLPPPPFRRRRRAPALPTAPPRPLTRRGPASAPTPTPPPLFPPAAPARGSAIRIQKRVGLPGELGLDGAQLGILGEARTKPERRPEDGEADRQDGAASAAEYPSPCLNRAAASPFRASSS